MYFLVDAALKRKLPKFEREERGLLFFLCILFSFVLQKKKRMIGQIQQSSSSIELLIAELFGNFNLLRNGFQWCPAK